MEIRNLITFIRIAEVRNFSKAAEQLGYSQSAVTMQIKQLEKRGFVHVGNWTFEQADNMIARIAAQGWKGVPRGVNPATYVPGME